MPCASMVSFAGASFESSDRGYFSRANADIRRVPGRASAVHDVPVPHHYVIRLNCGGEEQQGQYWHIGSIAPVFVVTSNYVERKTRRSPEAPEVREYANFRVRNTVDIGHELGARVRRLLAGIAGLLCAGRDRRNPDAALVCRSAQRRLRARYRGARAKRNRPTLKHCLEAKPFEPQAEILLPTSDAMLAFIASGLLTHPEMVGLNPEYLHELMWGARAAGGPGPRAAGRQAVPLRYQRRLPSEARRRYRGRAGESARLAECAGAAAQPRLTTDRSISITNRRAPPATLGVFEVSFPTAVDRFITLWEMAGEVISDPIIKEATDALKAGGGGAPDPRDAEGDSTANRELLTLHELIAHRLVQILLGLHRGRTFSIPTTP